MNDSPTTLANPPRSWPRRFYDFLSGFGLATALLLILGLLTWLATLEQIDHGLYPTLQKYFSWKSWYIIPEINKKPVWLPLPGGYWVCALLFINLLFGGVIRIRKGWRSAGNLISHFGILLMLAGGGVAHHLEERGHMAIAEGVTSNTAEDYFEYVIEVAEITDGQPSKVHVIRGEYFDDLTNQRIRKLKLPQLPFDLQVGNYLQNARPMSIADRAPTQGHTDGYYLVPLEADAQTEANAPALFAQVVYRDGTTSPSIILSALTFHPYTIEHDGRIFTLDLRKRLWPMPFAVHLKKFEAKFYPGTSKPAEFISHIERLEDDHEIPVTIQMNEPMRTHGLTFFQASYRPSAPGSNQMMSVFEVVRNPADKWPEYSLYIVAFGMAVTFLTKLFVYLTALNRKS